MHFALHPLTIDPRPDLFEFAEVDLGIEVGRKVFAVATGVHIQNVDRVYLVDVILFGICGPHVDDTWIETDAENSVDARFLGSRFLFPFVVRVPRRIFGNFLRIFVNRCVHVRHRPESLRSAFALACAPNRDCGRIC